MILYQTIPDKVLNKKGHFWDSGRNKGILYQTPEQKRAFLRFRPIKGSLYQTLPDKVRNRKGHFWDLGRLKGSSTKHLRIKSWTTKHIFEIRLLKGILYQTLPDKVLNKKGIFEIRPLKGSLYQTLPDKVLNRKGTVFRLGRLKGVSTKHFRIKSWTKNILRFRPLKGIL